MENSNIENIRHSLSHVLAMAVLELFPEAKLGIGPAVENGFYYDFDLPRNLAPADISKLEQKMREIINKDLPFEQSDIDKTEAKKLFKNQLYKIELIKDIPGEEVSIYTLGKRSLDSQTTLPRDDSSAVNFTDLCAGPHLDSTKELKEIGWKLDKIAGAYWRGSEKNKMLQRIYGLAFENKEGLNRYIEMTVEAEKRDHKKIGRDLDLFSFHPEAPGCPFWHKKGMILWNTLEQLGKDIRKKYGYIEIKTPLLAKNSLWITSGHWDHYKESMFSFDVDGETYCLKPMDCPFNIKIFQTGQRSYKELPIRYTEIGRVYRKEKSGELNGLLRVSEITQDDSHIFLREDQIKTEVGNLIEMVKEFYGKLGLIPDFFFSTRPDDFIGEISVWDKAEADLKESLDAKNIKYGTKEKDGAFYGPKIDVSAKDALGRSWQVATIQLDFQLPGRFKCEYIDEEGKCKTPVMIHAAVFGSFERMIGILTEHYAGAFPAWLAPVQVIVLPIAERHNEYAEKISKTLEHAGIRVQTDNRNESIGKKIRESEMQKVPFMLIVGDKEMDAGKVAVRKYGQNHAERGEGDEGVMDISEIIHSLNNL